LLRRDHIRTRPLRALVAASILLGVLPLAALAQETGPQPVIDQAPFKVRFGAVAVIKGHLENGTPGDEVALQSRRAGGDWWVASTKQVDENLEVEFRRQDMKRTTTYRLVYTDLVTEVETTSEERKVRVAPKLTLRVKPDDIFQGRYVTLRGELLPKVSGRTVVLKQLVRGEWKWIRRVAVNDGRFVARFQANHKGFRKVRVKFSGDGLSTAKKRIKPLTVYERDPATWYGPGFYGRRTACGQKMSSTILGVAHRTLPCGTKVAILYNGRTITVPVIDRGPYSHANWDLTEGAARRLGFSGTDIIGVAR
jgi:rare lipoprotein A